MESLGASFGNQRSVGCPHEIGVEAVMATYHLWVGGHGVTHSPRRLGEVCGEARAGRQTRKRSRGRVHREPEGGHGAVVDAIFDLLGPYPTEAGENLARHHLQRMAWIAIVVDRPAP